MLALKKRIVKEEIEDEIFEAIAEGLSIQKVCEKFDISSRKMLYDWKKNNPDLEEKFAAARLISADAHAEMAGEALENAGVEDNLLTGPEVSLAVGISKYRQWLAGVRDRDQYGSQDRAHVEISFGALHMDALMSPGARPSREIEIPEGDYEIIEAGEVIDDGETDAYPGQNETGSIARLAEPASTLSPELGDLI